MSADDAAVPGETIELTVQPPPLCLPNSVDKGDEFEVVDRFDGPKTIGVVVKITVNGETYTTFRIPEACYETVEVSKDA